MYAVPDTFREHPPTPPSSSARPPRGRELYRAHIVRHAFEPGDTRNEAFGLGAIEAGVERFLLPRRDHLAPADTLVPMNPDELHTGRAETAAGWRYRMAYLDAPVLEQISGERGWWFADAERDAALRAARRPTVAAALARARPLRL